MAPVTSILLSSLLSVGITEAFTPIHSYYGIINSRYCRAHTSLQAKKTKKKTSSTQRLNRKGFGNTVVEKEPDRIPKDGADTPCGCGSGAMYDMCCGKFHSGEHLETSAEQVLRARFTAYKYRLPDFLVDSTLKFVKSHEGGGLGRKRTEAKRAVKEEKTELLKFIDSYDFSDLQVLETFPVIPAPEEDEGPSQSIKFGCKLRARSGGALQKAPAGDDASSQFLAENVVDFQEVSVFKQLRKEGRWVYDRGDVEYSGETLAERFDTPERQQQLADQRAKRETRKTPTAAAMDSAQAAPTASSSSSFTSGETSDAPIPKEDPGDSSKDGRGEGDGAEVDEQTRLSNVLLAM